MNFPVSMHGFGLSGVMVQSQVPGIVIQTVGTSSSQVDMLVTLPADLASGPVSLLVADTAVVPVWRFWQLHRLSHSLIPR